MACYVSFLNILYYENKKEIKIKEVDKPDDNTYVHGSCQWTAETFGRFSQQYTILNSDSDVCIAVIVGKKQEPRNPVPTFLSNQIHKNTQNS